LANMDPKLRNKLLKIRQGNATWQCTLRRAPVWITPKKQAAYRPFILLVVDQDSGMVIKTEIVDKCPDPQAVLAHLLDTMLGSILTMRQKHRPARICIDEAELVQYCAPQMAEVGVRVELRASLPQLSEALHELEIAMNQREPTPGLLSVPGASVPLMAELVAAAAEFSRQAPWRYFVNFEPIELRYPSDSQRTRYAIVLGSGGEFYGLSLYESLTDLDVVFSSTPGQPTRRPITWVSLILEEAAVLSYDDLDAIERYSWPVVGEKAYPFVMKATSGIEESEVPSASEQAWLAAALRAIPVFLTQHLRADRGLPHPAQTILPLPDIHSNQQIMLRYPATGARTAGSFVAQTQDPELEAFIQGWHSDEKSHDYARQMGAFLFEFLDDLDANGLSEQTIIKHERNCWAIGWLEAHYGKHATFSAEVFLGGPKFIQEHKQKICESKSSITSYTMRAPPGCIWSTSAWMRLSSPPTAGRMT